MKRYFSAISSSSNIQSTVTSAHSSTKDISGCIPISSSDSCTTPSCSSQETISVSTSSNNSNEISGEKLNSHDGVKLKAKYCQKSRSAWSSDPLLKNWIIFKENAVECKYCRTIFNQPKLSTLKDHANTKKHMGAAEPFSTARQTRIKFSTKATLTATHEAEARISLYIAKHTSICSVDHITQIIKKNYPDSSICLNTKLCRTKCTGIITNLWYPYFKTKISKDVGESPYSLLVDESTDISVVKYLGIVIRYFNNEEKCLKTNLLKLEPLESCDAGGIVDAIMSVLGEYNLKMQNMVGLGTDNANVMTGIHKGGFAKLKALNPKLVLIPCVCHSLQLAISSAAVSCIPKEIEFTISKTYNWFARSCNRQLNYQNLYKLINDGHNPLKITQSCATRWMSIESAVSRIHHQYLELKTYFRIAEIQENCFKITSLAKMYDDEINFAYLCFLKPILNDVQRVNKIFESETAEFIKVLIDLEYLIINLIKKIVKFNYNDGDAPIYYDMIINVAELQSQPYLGFECEDKLFELKSAQKITIEQ